MKVITGSARGRRLETPSGQDTRPTAAKVKEAVFSMIQFEVEGASVLDLFAGSGQMGIEALSRGAKFCVFVDTAKTAQAVVRQNLAHTQMTGRGKLVGADAMSYLQTARGPFDIVFLDPPYAAGLMLRLLECLTPLVAPGGVVVCETARGEPLPETVGNLVRGKERPYGKTQIVLYRPAAE